VDRVALRGRLGESHRQGREGDQGGWPAASPTPISRQGPPSGGESAPTWPSRASGAGRGKVRVWPKRCSRRRGMETASDADPKSPSVTTLRARPIRLTRWCGAPAGALLVLRSAEFVSSSDLFSVGKGFLSLSFADVAGTCGKRSYWVRVMAAREYPSLLHLARGYLDIGFINSLTASTDG